jgi:hypothetical protein
MTKEELVKIITEVIESQRAFSKAKILATAVDEADKADVLAAATQVSDDVTFVPMSGLDGVTENYDMLFFDYVALDQAAEFALGLTITPLGRKVFAFLSRGKPTYILKKDPKSPETKPRYRTLLKRHWGALAELGMGVCHGDWLAQLKEKCSCGCDCGCSGGASSNTVKYTKNVLSRADVAEYASAGKIVICKDVVVTCLAAETAKKMGIDIVRE